MPCDGPRMNPSVDVGNPPRPFRHLRMAEHRSPDPSSSRVPVHSALVQKSVTAITNLAGRLSIRMLGKSRRLGKWKLAKRWQTACNQSNGKFTKGTCGACGSERRRTGQGGHEVSLSGSFCKEPKLPKKVFVGLMSGNPPPGLKCLLHTSERTSCAHSTIHFSH